MIAGYKRNNRHKRMIRKLNRKGGSASDWKALTNRGYISFKYSSGEMQPRGIRMQQMFKLQRHPDLRKWYFNKVSSSNLFCSFKGRKLLIYE